MGIQSQYTSNTRFSLVTRAIPVYVPSRKASTQAIFESLRSNGAL